MDTLARYEESTKIQGKEKQSLWDAYNLEGCIELSRLTLGDSKYPSWVFALQENSQVHKAAAYEYLGKWGV